MKNFVDYVFGPIKDGVSNVNNKIIKYSTEHHKGGLLIKGKYFGC